ncbi:MAG TPA: hypothetical protein VN516_09335 [Candidatus Baltobacteraceae bacterium]|nr:hypothetical protein [Candidatus Baltobacteraceae bacterium]
MATTPLNKEQLRPLLYPRLVRLGPPTDGGYVVPEDQIAKCNLLVSLGLSDNWTFDKDFLKLNPSVKIIGVDHTVGSYFFISRLPLILFRIVSYALIFNRKKIRKHTARLNNYLGYFTFFKKPHKHIKKRMSDSMRDPLDITLDAVLNAAGPGKEHDVFLKMDIEGAEYGLVPEIIKNRNRIRCIAAEFHWLDKQTEDFNRAIRALNEHFSLIHIHANNIGPYDHANDFPIGVEITWINKDLLKEELPVSTLNYPREDLDIPNTITKPDYKLAF